jgi:RNA polymerase sigma-70 factor, ECF subfamily
MAPSPTSKHDWVNDDAELVQRIRDGATDEFAELVRRHQSQVRGIVGRYERDPHLCDDLAQETFIKAWRALASFDGRAPFVHWLSRIAVRTAIDHLRRKRARAGEVGFDDLGEDALDWLRTGDNEPEPGLAREVLEVAMRELSSAEQVVITLQEIEGRSVKEISQLTGSSGVAVRVRAMRARTKLRKALEKMERQTP